MSNNPTLKVVGNSSGNGAGNADNPEPAPNPFDVESLRLTQDFIGTAGVKKLLTTVPVKKPGRQDFIRVHPSPAYRFDARAIVLKEDDETYLVHPSLHDALLDEMIFVTIFTAITRQGVAFLWPVRLQSPEDRPLAWWTSAREAAEMAIQKWIRITANKALGAYEITSAESLIADPEWPSLSFQQLIEIAFRDRLIDRMDHPVVKRLRGLK
jgi:hypothetical protein